MNLIIIGHPDKASFCYNGILNTMKKRFEYWSQDYEVIDLYEDKFSPSRWYKNQNDVKKYQVSLQGGEKKHIFAFSKAEAIAQAKKTTDNKILNVKQLQDG